MSVTHVVQNKAYRVLFFLYFKDVKKLNEIGVDFKEARLNSSVSLEEASEDTGIPVTALEQIEDGAIGSFKDIFKLKEYLSIYAKYLGLNGSEIIDKFNEYMFEYTSRIPMKEIERQVTQLNKEKEVESVVSPYTKPGKKFKKSTYYLIYGVSIFVVIIIIIWSVLQILSSRV